MAKFQAALDSTDHISVHPRLVRKNPYILVGVPRDVRLVPPEELVGKMNNNPGLRAAIELAGRVEGHVKSATVLFQKQATHSRAADMAAEEQRRAIILQKRKLAGEYQDDVDHDNELVNKIIKDTKKEGTVNA